MVDLDEFGAPVWIEHVWDEDTRHIEWLPFKDAFERLADWEDEPQSKAVDLLKEGIWTASFSRARVQGGIVPISPHGGFSSQLNIASANWTRHRIDANLGTGIVGRKFWLKGHKTAGPNWSFETGFLWPDGVRLEVERGVIETFEGFHCEQADDNEYLGLRITVFGLSISASDVDAVAPRRAKPAETSLRGTSFDWETAFADVAAELYFDLQFEDVNARGIPAQLIKALQRSFERRKLRVPEHSSLKAKAKILAGALRSKGS